jgi:ABA responsive element binding factor
MHQYPPQQQYALPRPLPLGAAAPGPALDAAYRGDRAGVFLSHSHSQLAGRKRGAAAAVAEDGVVERTVERRQKRMIKNRESAARSRARKQVGFHFHFQYNRMFVPPQSSPVPSPYTRLLSSISMDFLL